MRPSRQDAEAGRRPFDALVIWAALASFGIAIGILALVRNFERVGPGRRWRGAQATGPEVDALLADEERERWARRSG